MAQSIADQMNIITKADSRYIVRLVDSAKLTVSSSGNLFPKVSLGPSYIITKEGSLMLNGQASKNDLAHLVESLNSLFGEKNVLVFQ